MPTNEERREVAAKLRELSEGVLDSREYEHRAICSVVGCWGDGEYSDMELKDRLADLVEPEPERTCLVLCVKHGPVFDVLRFSCCGYEWAENRTDRGATEPDPNYCPNCGAKVVEP